MQWRGGAGSPLARHGLSPCTQQCRAHFPRFSVSPLVTGPQKVRCRPHAGQGEPREENPRCADVGVHSAGLDLLPGRGRYLRRQFGRRARVMPPLGRCPWKTVCGVHGLRRGAVHEERLAVIQVQQGPAARMQGGLARACASRAPVLGDRR